MMELYVGQKRTGISILPNSKWPNMWRVCQNSYVSGIDRAKDAAIHWARPRGLGGEETVRWKLRETRSRAA